MCTVLPTAKSFQFACEPFGLGPPKSGECACAPFGFQLGSLSSSERQRPDHQHQQATGDVAEFGNNAVLVRGLAVAEPAQAARGFPSSGRRSGGLSRLV